jgi:predicted RNase H-like nuclease (RuvC/YqgF family)
MNNTTITMPLKEYEALKHNVVHLKQIVDDRTILVVNDFGTEKMRYVSVEGNKLFSELQTRVKYLEQREKNWIVACEEWNKRQGEYEQKIDRMERKERMTHSMEENYRVLKAKYDLLKRELDEKQPKSAAYKYFHRYFRPKF